MLDGAARHLINAFFRRFASSLDGAPHDRRCRHPWRRRIARPVRSKAMKPAGFDYARCETVDDALALLAEHGEEARVIAGGQSLMAMLNMRLVRPSILVDIAAARRAALRQRSRRLRRIRRHHHAGRGRSLACICAAPAADRRGHSAYRPFPDPQPRHRLRLALPRRSELGIAALPRDAGRRSGAPVAPQEARAQGGGIPDRHAVDRESARRDDGRCALSGRARRLGLCVS